MRAPLKVPKEKARLSRRKFLLRCGLGGGAASMLGGAYARWIEPVWPAVERRRMDLPGLDPAFEGRRVVQISDFHASGASEADYLRKQIVRCVQMDPELIVITGDFLTLGDPAQLAHVDRIMQPARDRGNVIAVLGNHDYTDHRLEVPRERRQRGAVGRRLTDALCRLGVVVLENERFVIRRGDAVLQIVGLGDLVAGHFNAQAAFAEVDATQPCIALSHNPDTIVNLTGQPCNWVLCGHTHGGQVRVPFVGAVYLPVYHGQYDMGCFDVRGTRLYVNRGLGCLRRVRFNCRPEITEFTLVRRA